MLPQTASRENALSENLFHTVRKCEADNRCISDHCQAQQRVHIKWRSAQGLKEWDGHLEMSRCCGHAHVSAVHRLQPQIRNVKAGLQKNVICLWEKNKTYTIKTWGKICLKGHFVSFICALVLAELEVQCSYRESVMVIRRIVLFFRLYNVKHFLF